MSDIVEELKEPKVYTVKGTPAEDQIKALLDYMDRLCKRAAAEINNLRIEREVMRKNRMEECEFIRADAAKQLKAMQEELSQAHALVEDAKDIIAGLFNFDMGSADRALKFLDDSLPTHEDVRGILSDTSTVRTPE